MNRTRLIYGCLIIFTIITGLLSRQLSFIPVFVGDILWATMVYFIMRFLFTERAARPAIFFSILFCFAVEFSQLYKAPWINGLRHTLFGRLVLGDTFLWSDLGCYLAGIAIGWIADHAISRYLQKNNLRRQ